MSFLVQYFTPITDFKESLSIEQCLFIKFSESTIFYNQPNKNAFISRSSFASNNITNKNENCTLHIYVYAKKLTMKNVIMYDIKIEPAGMFFLIKCKDVFLFQNSFDNGYSKNGHNSFDYESQTATVSQINITNVDSVWDSGPSCLSDTGKLNYFMISEFTSFRSIFRFSNVPYEKVNVVNCSGQYLVSRENNISHFIDCAFSNITLSMGFDYIFDPATSKDVILGNCVIMKSNIQFDSVSTFVRGELFSSGETISFHIVNDCIQTKEYFMGLKIRFILLNTLLFEPNHHKGFHQ